MTLGTRLVLVIAVLAVPAWGQNWLSTPRILGTGAQSGIPIAIEDLDGDGHPDLVKFHWNSNSSVQVFWDDGSGEFIEGPSSGLPGGIQGGIALYGDLTGEGIGDLVVTTAPSSPYGGSLIVIPGTGAGQFGLPVITPFGETVIAATLGDVDGDGLLDVAVASETYGPSTRSLRWFVSSSSGALTPGPAEHPPYNSSYFDPVAIDWDGDGVPDVVAMTTPTGGAATLLAFRTVGLGFAPALSVPASGVSRLLRADVDGNGHDDLVAWSLGMGSSPFPPGIGISVRVFSNWGGGSWTIGPLQVFANIEGSQLHPGDWDGDGDLDLAFTMRNTSGIERMALLENTGGATFVMRSIFNAGSNFLDDRIPGMVDVDGDGRLDLLSAGAVYYGDGTFASPHLSASTPDPIVIRDVDGDGDLDLAGWLGSIGRNDGRGSFMPTQTLSPIPPAGLQYTNIRPFADLDGDGRLDYLATLQVPPVFPTPPVFVQTRLFGLDGNGTFTDVHGAAALGVQGLGGIPADVDGDGDLDLFGSLVWTNDGTGFFTSSPPTYAGWYPKVSADLDGDGDVDLVAIPALNAPSSPTVAVLRNAGGTLTAEPIMTGHDTSGIDPAQAVPPLVADLDDDGDLDIALDDQYDAELITILENVGGAFVTTPTITLTANSGIDPFLSAADVDGDGKTDLITSTVSGMTRVLRRVGPGFLYQPPRSFYLPDFRGTADIDSDGDVDLLGSTIAVRSRRHSPPGSGYGRQYGSGSIGTGGYAPLIGATGPLRVGLSASVRLRQAVGGSVAVVVVGSAESAVPGFPYPGLVSYVQSWSDFLVVPLWGPPGGPGAGGADLAFTVPAFLVNQSVFIQFGTADPALPNGISVSNGLEVHVGP